MTDEQASSSLTFEKEHSKFERLELEQQADSREQLSSTLIFEKERLHVDSKIWSKKLVCVSKRA